MLFPRRSENAVKTGDPPNFFSWFKTVPHCEARVWLFRGFSLPFCEERMVNDAV
jgi:hypothetical protein